MKWLRQLKEKWFPRFYFVRSAESGIDHIYDRKRRAIIPFGTSPIRAEMLELFKRNPDYADRYMTLSGEIDQHDFKFYRNGLR